MVSLLPGAPSPRRRTASYSASGGTVRVPKLHGAMRRNEEILAIETQLASGDDSTYERFLTEDALVIVPGAAMSKAETVAAMADSPGWLCVKLEGPTFLEIGDEHVLLSYDFHGERSQ